MTLFMKHCLQLFLVVVLFSSCSLTKQIDKSAREIVLKEDALQTAHVGISIYEPATGKYWYNYNGDKYFVPASNTKLPTCYAAMKYLGDSLVGLRYGIPEERLREKPIIIDATGDPTFLHKDYIKQPVFKFLQEEFLNHTRMLGFLIKQDIINRWGSGWSWNDYEETYMAERSSLPIFGNVVHVRLKDTAQRFVPHILDTWRKVPKPFVTDASLFDSLINKYVFVNRSELKEVNPKIKVTREIAANNFLVEENSIPFKETEIPFVTYNASTALQILSDTLNQKTGFAEPTKEKNKYAWLTDDGDIAFFHVNQWSAIHSQPTDSLLKPMMHRSDNFFAEQSLLMVSNERLGVMNDAKIIDTLLKTDFKDLPQKPRWVDGSGLSRYNLFSPQDFVFILNKMKTDFGMDRIKNILPTGNKGTLEGRFVPDSNYIFAKTGTLSGVVALSGFLYTKKNKLLIFSVLVNNHNASASGVRNAVEKFIHGVRENY
jgi:serine-type D-Ala-D-Ala carboxypeptidase/endopeptidase (penicillin-binding protein 4)